ncbi:BTB/POZ domain-containing protein At5g60050 [Phalaenopsis equestris]|uniref:BTB/POZ domain-containing protein At5g60050 n=1 Tax=Phalaenopsis equestris TaxID=78828 RepID=UPI0009E40B7A|nr:BTB/POZ domain-containing protein At5g60050 [Phalaenopsis equestris]
MAAAADSLLKSGGVSAMIRQGFLTPSSPSFPSSLFSPQLPSPPLSSPPPPSTFTSSSPSSSSSSSSSSHPSPSTQPTTLFDMISRENLAHRQPAEGNQNEKRLRVQERIARVLAADRPNWGPGDVELSVSSGDGFRVSMTVHRRVLAAGSRFFAENLGRRGGVVEICECDDVEVYVEVVAMMYCGDLRLRLCGQGAKQVLGLLKVSAAIMFDAGVAACLEHLEAVPWSEEEEEEVISVLSQLKLREPVAEVLQRVLVESSSSSKADAIFLRLLAGVLQSKDEKARRDMKALLLGLLREDNAPTIEFTDRTDVSRETLYHLCHKCVSSLSVTLSEAASLDESTRHDRGSLMADIAREADNIQWLVQILISKKIADEFVMLWAEQKELVSLHDKIPSIFRYEISRITARLCISLGKGEVLVPKEARFAVLSTWLDALYEDFGWMKRACRGLDKRMVEEGLCQMILTLSMPQQQAVLLRWFDRFLKNGDECPNLQRAFQVWWRRAFMRRFVAEEGGGQYASDLQIAVCDRSA